MDSYHHVLPKLGQTRCCTSLLYTIDLCSPFPDWALLSADLQFIYLDPVLAYHLDAQADLLVGKSLLSFVHPDEQASAKTDLRSVLESRTLHGSVTRCAIFHSSLLSFCLTHIAQCPFFPFIKDSPPVGLYRSATTVVGRGENISRRQLYGRRHCHQLGNRGSCPLLHSRYGRPRSAKRQR